jgi:S-adenosylmethionine synthetase
MPAAGEDIKVMGLRNGEKITLTIGIAFVSQFVESMDKYVDLKERIKRDVISNAQKITDKEIDVHINTGDSVEGADVYLTKSGLSWEAGDDGSVGRGNRVNGIITPFRHMSLEAAAGKNPVSHIGKIYNILSTEMAKSIANEYPQIQECDIAILSQIGRKISEPHHLNINLVVEEGADFDAIKGKADYIAAGYLEDIGKLTLDISLGKYKTF